MSNKIIRTICCFTDNPSAAAVAKLTSAAKLLEDHGYLIQTKRLCSTLDTFADLRAIAKDNPDYYTSVGTISYQEALTHFSNFCSLKNAAFNIDLANEEIEAKHVELLFKVIETDPGKTFDFNYTFNDAPSSPYFPSATYLSNGFAIGLQPTNLAKDCNTLEEWLAAMQACWQEIVDLFADDPEFLGIDSSIAPLGSGDGSLINFIKRLGYTFEHSATTDFYTIITRFIKENNPKPVGLCGLMLPCLEDVELAAEYDAGNFSIERNIFLSLHSGLGIDVYPIGTDEKPERIVEVLKLMQALSNKYHKPLSARFVSDGKTKIGEMTNFQHPYLTDCTVRAL